MVALSLVSTLLNILPWKYEQKLQAKKIKAYQILMTLFHRFYKMTPGHKQQLFPKRCLSYISQILIFQSCKAAIKSSTYLVLLLRSLAAYVACVLNPLFPPLQFIFETRNPKIEIKCQNSEERIQFRDIKGEMFAGKVENWRASNRKCKG